MKKLIFFLMILMSVAAFGQAHYDSAMVAAGDSLSVWFNSGDRERNMPTQKHLVSFLIDSTMNVTSISLEVAYDTTKPHKVYSGGSELSWTVDTTNNWAITVPATDDHPYEWWRFKFNVPLTDSQATYIKYETRSY